MHKKYLFWLIIYYVFLSIYACFGRELNDFDKFWPILTQLESSNNPKAVGDGGKAIGIAQIHEIYFLDAQKYDKNLRKYKYSDCFNPEISKLVVISYLSKYCKSNSFEEWARIHNGGPLGNNKQSTIKYWKKFLAIRGKQ